MKRLDRVWLLEYLRTMEREDMAVVHGG